MTNKEESQKIKCTLLNIFITCVPSENGISALDTLDLQQMNIKAALQWRRISRAIRAEYILIEESRKDLIEKYVERDAENKPMYNNRRYIIKDQNAFDNEWNDLMSTEMQLDVYPISLKSIENLKLSPANVDAIAFLIDETS